MFFLSLSLILIIGSLLGYLCNKIKIPALISYLLLGFVLCYFSLIDDSIINLSNEIRKIALIIILLKGGLSLNIKDLKKAGRPAILLSFIPAVCEMTIIGLIGPSIFDITYLESFLLGSVIGAVSPAVVVPRMIKMIESNQGSNKGIPQMIIASSSIDDIIMILCFTSFLTIESGSNLSVMTFVNVPLSIILGVGVGILTGILLSILFNKINIRKTLKLIITLGICFLYVFLENYLAKYIGFSSLLASITIGITILIKNKECAKDMAIKCDKLWSVAEIFLFVLVGASIQFEFLSSIFFLALLVIVIGLLIRMLATYMCTLKTNLNTKERTFVSLSYIPKATVQATIGGSLLDLGIQSNNQSIYNAGMIVLGVSVLAILITAPLGAFLIDFFKNKLTTKEENITSSI